jgi:hypothetical protein
MRGKIRHRHVSSFFISYRRQDSGGHAGRLSDRLVARFGNDHVFMDVQDIEPGQNYAASIEATLARCTHLLAVVGPRWLEILKARGAAGEDLVRHEISLAMKGGVTVIPVLVGGARMPSKADLPAELATFERCQAVEIRDDRFDDDCNELMAFLGADSARTGRISRRALIAAAVVAVVAAAVYFSWPRTPRAPEAARALGAPQASEAPRASDAPPSLTGEWIGQFQKSGQKPYRIRLRLAQTGKLLAGSVEYPTGDGPIVESRIEDDGTFTFATQHTPNFESEPATIRFQGQVVNGELRLVSTDRDGMATGVATRRASSP